MPFLVTVILCPRVYLLQVSHRIEVNMLKQVFPGEDSIKNTRKEVIQ